jgi:antitoxin HigA-1
MTILMQYSVDCIYGYSHLSLSDFFVLPTIAKMKRRLDQNHIPPVAMHPGELLRNEIKERGLKQTDLADKLSISQPFLNGLLREKKKISIELAIKLEEVLGIEAELWVKLQRLFDKIKTRNKTEISLQNLNISSQKRESILGAMMA